MVVPRGSEKNSLDLGSQAVRGGELGGEALFIEGRGQRERRDREMRMAVVIQREAGGGRGLEQMVDVSQALNETSAQIPDLREGSGIHVEKMLEARVQRDEGTEIDPIGDAVGGAAAVTSGAVPMCDQPELAQAEQAGAERAAPDPELVLEACVRDVDHKATVIPAGAELEEGMERLSGPRRPVEEAADAHNRSLHS